MISAQVRWCWAAGLAVLAASTFGAAAASSVAVLQVEAGSTSGYAPINFAGSSTVTSGGVVYHAWSSNASTYSSHAATVRNRLLSASGTAVSDIYCEYAGDFINDIYNSRATTATKLKNAGVRVVNNSWVGSTGDSATDKTVRQNLDYLIQQADVLMTSGAVSSSSAVTPIAWYAYNGLAVRGTQGFDASSTTTSGKSHADLWGPVIEEASYTTPTVAGYAAALIQTAKDGSSTNGQKHLTVKSLLMTGASKTNFSASGFTSWTRDTVNNLDTDAGAGRMDYSKSAAIFAAGEKSLAAISGSIVTSPTVSTTTEGWSLDSISSVSQEALVFYSSGAFDNLTATLCWDVVVSGTTDIFANLDLELRPVTYVGGVYTLGSATGITGLSSTAANDNVEHLYYTGTLAAGYYALVVNGVSVSAATPYGLSYAYDIAVPEPAALGLLALGVAASLRRRA